MNKAKIFIVAALAVMLLAGCKKDKVTLNLSDSDVTGTWRKDGKSEYCLYRSDHTGCKYNTDEGFSEDFPSYDYEWSVSGDQLTITPRSGVSYVYTVNNLTENECTFSGTNVPMADIPGNVVVHLARVR